MSAGELILTHGLVKMDFAIAELQSDRMGATGPGIVNELGTPRWMLQVETERLSQLQARLWSAWLVRRKGKAVTFTAWRLHRVNPYAQVDTPDGSIGLTINASASTITLTGLGVWAAGEGDMISYRTAASGFWCGEVDVGACRGRRLLDACRTADGFRHPHVGAILPVRSEGRAAL